MKRKSTFFLGVTLALLMVGAPAFAQLGIFENTADWGPRSTNKVAGSVSVSGDVYTVKGNGDDIWNNDDEGFFVYKELTGSWSLSAKVKWVDRGGDSSETDAEWAKVGVMMRENGATATSRHYWITLRAGTDMSNLGDQTAAQWRTTAGAASNSAGVLKADGTNVNDQGDGVWLRVSRIADAGIVVSQYSYDGVTWNFGHAQAMTFADSIAFGLAIANHVDNQKLAAATVSNVKLEQTVPAAGLRVLSTEDPVYIGGDPITVTLKVGGGSGSAQVVETPPAGWAISAISDGGTASAGTITWNVTGAKTLTYVITPPAGSTSAVSFSGMVATTPIQGSNSLVAPSPVGIFDNHLDVGAVSAAGSAEYDSGQKRYYVTGSGADIWDSADEFHFVYKKLSGAFSIEGLCFGYNDTSSSEWSKIGLMVRDNLTAGSPHMLSLYRGSDAQYDTGWRAAQDGSSSDSGLKTAAVAIGEAKLVRTGDIVQAYYMGADGEWVLDTSQNINLTDPVYVGLAVTAHEDGNFAIGEYDNVELTLYPFMIRKTFSSTGVNQGESVDVSVSVELREGVNSTIAIKETYSAATTITNLSASSGQATDDQNGTISWSVSGNTGVVTLNYTVNVPSDYADPFVTITGTYNDGKGYTGSTGTNSLAVQAVDLGIFQGHEDIGTVGAPGNVKVEGDTYQVVGSGADIWGTADSFHFLWLKAQGDFTFSVDDPYIGAFGAKPSSNEWQKMGLMVRQERTAPSAYIYSLIRSSDQALMLQWRDASGAEAAWTDGSQSAASEWNPNYDAASAGIVNPALDQVALGGTLKLTREGDIFTLWYVYDGEDYFQYDHTLVMTDPVYVGIAVTAHESGSTSQGLFKNAKFEGTTVDVKAWMLY